MIKSNVQLNKIPCSVLILAFNSGKFLDQCLASVQEFAEIIINDGGSSDNTLDIARKYNCKIISQDQKFKNKNGSINDFSGLRNQLIANASYEWVLILDSDELVSSELVGAIKMLDFNEKYNVYNVSRKYIVEGKLVELSSTYPNYQIRLFNKSTGIKYIKPIHEKLIYNNDSKVIKINQPFYVPFPCFKEFKVKSLKYLNMQLKMWGNLTFKKWFKWILIFHARASLGYAWRLFCIQFKKGKKLPLNYELFQIYYNFLLIFRSFMLINKIK